MDRNREQEILEQHDAFILKAASIVCGRQISRSDDEYSIALSAFWEAEKSHDPSKGSLETFASVVIRHRLIDYIRKTKTSDNREIVVEPDVFTDGLDEGSEFEGIRQAVEKKITGDMPQPGLAEEISELAEVLRRYQIDFFDLPKCCPKAHKTRAVCLKAARFVCAILELLERLRRTLRLPAAEMEPGVPISRKLLDKFRKYIIASIEIEAGDFPGIQEYFSGAEEA